MVNEVDFQSMLQRLCACGYVKFLVPLPGTKLITIELVLPNWISVLLYFPFLFDCIGSVGDCASRNFRPYMWSWFQYEADPEMERTFRLRRKMQRLHEQTRKARRKSPIRVGGSGEQIGTLTYFASATVHGIASCIARPNMEANNFHLKPALISKV